MCRKGGIIGANWTNKGCSYDAFGKADGDTLGKVIRFRSHVRIDLALRYITKVQVTPDNFAKSRKSTPIMHILVINDDGPPS